MKQYSILVLHISIQLALRFFWSNAPQKWYRILYWTWKKTNIEKWKMSQKQKSQLRVHTRTLLNTTFDAISRFVPRDLQFNWTWHWIAKIHCAFETKPFKGNTKTFWRFFVVASVDNHRKYFYLCIRNQWTVMVSAGLFISEKKNKYLFVMYDISCLHYYYYLIWPQLR